MGRKIIFSILILLLLAISCNGPQSPFWGKEDPEEPSNDWYLGARGTPLYAYLDENYAVLEQDNGALTARTAVFIEGNNLAEDVLAVSEISADDCDDAVHLINQNSNTAISMSFRKGQSFPWLIEITSGGRKAKVRLFGCNYERFTMEFEENGISGTIENVKLSQNALKGYSFIPSLAKEQNIRLRNIFTVLGVYESISRSLSGNTDAERTFVKQSMALRRSLSGNAVAVGTVISQAFNDKSFISFAVTVKPAKVITSAVEYKKSEDAAFNINNVPSLTQSTKNIIAALLPSRALSPLSVDITSGGVPVNPQKIHYIERGGEMIFNFQFANFTENTDVNLVWYDSVFIEYYPLRDDGRGHANSTVYPCTQENGSPVGRFTENYSIKIKRDDVEGNGFHDGTAALLIFFGQDTVVNGNSTGINFWEPGTSGPELHKSVFMIQFTVRSDKATP
jgi:hypothetical protein